MSQQINLVNSAFKKQSRPLALPAMLQILALIVAGALAFYGYAGYRLAALEKLAVLSQQRFDTEQARMLSLTAEFSAYQKSHDVQVQLQQLEKQVAQAQALVSTLRTGSVSNTAGFSEYMRAFSRQQVQGLWLTAFDISGDGAQMSLSGGVTAPEQVPSYIQKLGTEKIMQGKHFSRLQMQQPEAKSSGERASYVEFTLHSVPEREAGK